MKKYGIFIVIQEAPRFYGWANKQEVVSLFTNKKLIWGYKFFARLLIGANLLEIENKKNEIIKRGEL